MILDTNLIIEKYRSSEEIIDNISIVSSVEFPPVLESKLFEGAVYSLTPEDQVIAIKLQKRLRDEGEAVPAPDLLIAATAINRGEKLNTNDEDMQQISSISELEISF